MSVHTAYHRPTDLESVCQLLEEVADPTIIAGGQTLGLMINEGIASPETLVDINDVEALDGIERNDDTLTVGAITTHHTIATSELVEQTVPVLGSAASSIADRQIRNAGTIGGVMAYADPTADYPPVLLALDATICSRTADDTIERDAVDFFVGYYESALGPTEIVTEIQLPVIGSDTTNSNTNTGAGFEKLAYRDNDRALVNVCASLTATDGTCETATIAVGGVSDRPRLAESAGDSLAGTSVTDDDIETAAEIAAEELPVDDDPMISTSYRESMIETMTRSALETARTEVRL